MTMRTSLIAGAILVLLLAVGAAGCGGGTPEKPLPAGLPPLALSSPAFRDGGTLPRRYTCDGDDVSPPLAWTRVPQGARALTLVVEDPDADGFVHWTVLDLPVAVSHVAEGRVPADAVETENSFGERGWRGPCPPEGDDAHRYVFALYATRSRVGLGSDASSDAVREKLASVALARGTLTARYARR